MTSTTITSRDVNVADGTITQQGAGSFVVATSEGSVSFTPENNGTWTIRDVAGFVAGVAALAPPAAVKPFFRGNLGVNLLLDGQYGLASTGFGTATAGETSLSGKLLDGLATSAVQYAAFTATEALGLAVVGAFLPGSVPLTALAIGFAVLAGAAAGTWFSGEADFDPIAQALSAYIGAVKDLFESSSDVISPLVLDLDGDGVELTALAGSQAFFDLDADGFAEQTGWVTGGDGLLALDSNGDGRISNINELFGNATTDGFTILGALDSNSDGIISSGDAQFSNLRIWIDANGNGSTETGELATLADHGVVSLNLAATQTNTTQNGNLISHISSFTRADNSSGQVADVWFANDQVNTQFTGEFPLDPRVFVLPRVRGYGEVADLHIAMSLDPALFAKVESLAACDPGNCSDLGRQIDEIIYRWAGVEAIDPASRGGLIDARHLAALEKFMGQPWSGLNGSNPQGIAAAEQLEEAWRILQANVGARLLVQGTFKSEFLDVLYSHQDDRFTGTADFNAAIGAIQTHIPSGFGAAASYWITVDSALRVLAGDLGYDSAALDSALGAAIMQSGVPYTLAELRGFDVLAGGSGDDVLGDDAIVGANGPDLLLGQAGNDTLSGRFGNDLLDGGAGNDILLGGQYSAGPTGFDSDTYVFGLGYGQDLIDDDDKFFGSNHFDVLQLGSGILAEGLTVRRSGINFDGIDVVITLNGTSDRITIDDQFAGDAESGVEEIRFADGTAWGRAAIAAQALIGGDGDDRLVGFSTSDTITGAAGDDTLIGGSGSDVLDGGAGNDTLVGGQNSVGSSGLDSDTYLFGLGYGQDLIDDDDNYFGSNHFDVLQLGSGILAEGLTVRRSGLNFDGIDVVITVNGTGDRVTIDDQFTSDAESGVEEIRFADGTVWDRAAIAAQALIGGDGDDRLVGFSTADTILGAAGNDTLIGGGGNDLLDGGSGNDSMSGGFGDDTYVVDGAGDTVTEGSSQGADTVRSAINFILGNHVENLILLGSADLRGDGNGLANVLTGNSGSNILMGLGGADLLDGGAGNDLLDGGLGSDTFVFRPGYGSDTIQGFTAGAATEDLIDIRGMGIGDFTTLSQRLSQNGSDTVIDFDNGDVVRLAGISSASLHQDDFVFA